MELPSWLILALVSFFAWGTYNVIAKIVTNKDYFGLSPQTTGVMMLIGIAIVFGGYFLLQPQELPSNPTILGLAILIGIIWAIGQLFAFIVLSQGAPVSKITPIYNSNTLIAVFLGIVLLNELPNKQDVAKVVVGAILIVAGAFLVSS